ncbi:hypothetical protein PVAND_017085 [Polypedilum vanderplanki]|uniref:RING-type domain-containing protein n=1 Tax=Polypedilum vanderplanki TaxID=319348 RepID=A0A9J6BHQ8_POLVA|nr:hypothetical protein PVAND_017085 [Polypedilum vanderplanki]
MNIECSICSHYLLAEQACSLSCGHVFHKSCIIRYRRESNLCPQCRSSIKKTTDLHFTIAYEEEISNDDVKSYFSRTQKSIENLEEQIRSSMLLLHETIDYNSMLCNQQNHLPVTKWSQARPGQHPTP